MRFHLASNFTRICREIRFVALRKMQNLKETSAWNSIPCPRAELRLDICLVNGQSFRWCETAPGEWTNVLSGRVWTLSQTEDHILYRVQHNCNKDSDKKNTEANESFLRDYFQLEVNVQNLYENWCKVDDNFKSKASCFEGVRPLRQDPVENLFSFICSSNNNISRISQMVEKLCWNYGEKVLQKDGKDYFDFPTIENLASDDVEQRLRDLGFGYRAKFISGSAQYIQRNCGPNWLQNLRSETFEDARSELMKLPGVGAKVADCVCLMSLDKSAAIPVDTHVLQIAARDYKLMDLGKKKSLTNNVYRKIYEHFHGLWGEYAGWAQSVMFSAELKKFQNVDSKAETGNRTQTKRRIQTSTVSKEDVCTKVKKKAK